jgi:hypothetical protein
MNLFSSNLVDVLSTGFLPFAYSIFKFHMMNLLAAFDMQFKPFLPISC